MTRDKVKITLTKAQAADLRKLAEQAAVPVDEYALQLFKRTMTARLQWLKEHEPEKYAQVLQLAEELPRSET